MKVVKTRAKREVFSCSCIKCHKAYSSVGIITHYLRAHTCDVRFQNAGHKKGDPSFVGKNQYIKAKELGLPIPIMSDTARKAISIATTARNITVNHRQKVSLGLQKYFKANPDKIPYRKYHYSRGRSYPEILFAKTLTERGIVNWVQEYQMSIYSYDFAFPSIKLDVEIDGNTHTSERVKNIDLRRDEWSRTNGWDVIRFKAKEVNNDANKCVDIVEEFIKNKLIKLLNL